MSFDQWFGILKDIAVPIGLFLLGWIKNSQSKHSENLNSKLDIIGKDLSGLHTRVAVLEDRGRRAPSYLPPGKTRHDQFEEDA